MFINLFSFFLSFLLVAGLVVALYPVAQNVGLVDRPCSRKQHEGEVPLIGGLAIYTAITISSFIITPFDAHYKMYLLSTSFMVFIGALDDFHDLDARLRLIAQTLIASLMVFGADLYIQDLGDIWGSNIVELGSFGPIFTVLAVVTCINAFNMTDGVDGLVGTLSLNAFIAIGVLVVTANTHFDNSVMSMFIGAVVAFMFFNFGSFKGGKYKIFMGDAGSMLMGLTVIWLITYSTNSEQNFLSPITAVWIIAIPLMDMFSVMFRRIRNGDSPLKASRDHIHHIFLKNGCSSKTTTLYISVIAGIFSSVGILSEYFSIDGSIMASLFVILFFLYNYIMIKLSKP
ncbi:UDP-N-acetylglucosamine--undecaprenyl-phosphate N-acetylglucosaminephosphotransferase [Paraglaciecola sp.]|uniref:UDP-N-acetylglucosamine--undecaprenyl-phosphate N-acetylglucosaminephosphotransferase n=1 Tax=Paraglaciecola sp. TaxID=1920173 RepID=UPI003EFB030B